MTVSSELEVEPLAQGTPEQVSEATAESSVSLVISPLTGARVAGEIDLDVHDQWQTTLDDLVGQGTDVYLELSELAFIDARGASLLVAASERLGAHRMVLYRPSSVLRRVLGALWPSGVPSLVVAEEGR